ncbi:transcription antitermination factor NusB [Bacillus lacus]|uniref:Transcription antitermination protein NusB n=1 Tax=Metabacillus lacus TaxID=1983721 RepID=A0A7X2J0N5_9BACI|nr:transcription antitermination factor NusB [Metabacillus lacus]MRX73166.1 transcription antitermination factor NusB [Metabacillus lacus]
MKRRTAREVALQALFQIDVSGIEPSEAIQHALDGKENDPFLETLVNGTLKHQEEIDALIKPHLVKWTLERLANVDRAVLRMSVFEMRFMEEIPVSVSIDEAIELSKTFGDDSSSRFVNGVLSNVKNSL